MMTKKTGILNRILQYPYLLLFALIFINLTLGAFIVSDFGETWDEQSLREYTKVTIEAYTVPRIFSAASVDYGNNILRYYGPAYLLVAWLIGKGIHLIFNSWAPVVVGHYVNFMTFQLGLMFFYLLALRFLRTKMAIINTLFYSTFSLLWGHAFINPKDTPFMVFFLGSIYLGLSMADGLSTGVPQKKEKVENNNELYSNFRFNWKNSSSNAKVFFIAVLLVIVAYIVFSIPLKPELKQWTGGIITMIYKAKPSSLVGLLFSRFAENTKTVSVDLYIEKGHVILDRVILLIGILLVITLIYILCKIFNRLCIYINERWLWPFLKSIYTYVTNPCLLMGSFFLGLCTATRTLGPLAGFLVCIYLIWKKRKNAIIPILIYWIIAAMVTYISWPFLWNEPLKHFIESFQVMSEFPFTSDVLFAGQYFAAADLPRSYLPLLISVQFTEPFLILLLFGIGIILWRVAQRGLNWQLFTILLGWFFIPFIAAIVFRPPMYDNFRQFLFIIPPLFLITGFALDNLYYLLPKAWTRISFGLILLLPGIFFTIHIHPYQYTYYNTIVGGVSGAFREFENDYWATSFKEATEYVNKIAPKGAMIVTSEPHHIVRNYAREDLEVELYPSGEGAQLPAADFAISTTRLEKDTYIFPEAKLIYQVQRDGAVFSVVRLVNKDMNIGGED